MCCVLCAHVGGGGGGGGGGGVTYVPHSMWILKRSHILLSIIARTRLLPRLLSHTVGLKDPGNEASKNVVVLYISTITFTTGPARC